MSASPNRSQPNATSRPLVSVVTAAFNEQENIPVLYRRVSEALADLHGDWELVIVDDHSTDATFEAIRRIAEQDDRVCGIRLARNRGSHIAKLAGYDALRGRCAVGLAAALFHGGEIEGPDVIVIGSGGNADLNTLVA